MIWGRTFVTLHKEVHSLPPCCRYPLQVFGDATYRARSIYSKYKKQINSFYVAKKINLLIQVNKTDTNLCSA